MSGEYESSFEDIPLPYVASVKDAESSVCFSYSQSLKTFCEKSNIARKTCDPQMIKKLLSNDLLLSQWVDV